jgi:hypothetical protein
LKVETHHPTPLLWLADDDTLINEVVFGQVDTLILEVMRHERRSKGEDCKEHGTALQTLTTAQEQCEQQQHRHSHQTWPKGQRQLISEGDADAESDGYGEQWGHFSDE